MQNFYQFIQKSKEKRRHKDESYQALIENSNAQLEKAVNSLNHIMDSSPDVICTIDAQGRFVQVSAASTNVWGYAPEELVGRLYMDLVAEQDKNLTIQVAGSIMRGIPVTTFENHYVRPDGSLVPVLWSAKWIDEDQMMYCIAKDATEKKKLEKAFRNEQKRFNDLFMQAPTSICVLKGSDHQCISANPLFDQLMGGRTVIGQTLKDAFPELAQQGILEKLDKVYKTGYPYFGLEHLVQLDYEGTGELTDIYLDILFQPYSNNEGEVEGVFFFGVFVSEQVQTRKKIEESERNLRIEKTFSEALLEFTPDGMVGFNDKGEIILFNKKAESLFGYTQEEILGLPLVTLLPGESPALHHGRRKNFFANLTEKKLQANSREMLGLRKDGHVFPVDVRLNLLHSYKGKIVLTSIRDITERKLAERQLKESEKNLKAILSSSQEAIYLLDLNYRLILLNEQCRSIIKEGYGVECQPGDDFPGLFEPDFKSVLLTIYQKVLAGEKWESERMIPISKEETYYYSTYFPVRDNEGNIIGICCSAKNITERKKIEEAMKIANAEKEEYQYRFKAILDYSPQAILIKDMEGKYIFSNKAFLNLFDLDRNNEVSEQLKPVFDDQLARAEFLAIGNTGNRREIATMEWKQQVVLTNAQTLEMEVIKFPLYDQQKRLFGICTLCKDTTEQMHHQQQLIKARENAEHAERLQEQFLANMSHELRTPMNGIIGMVNLLLTSSSLQPDQKGRLQVIKHSSDTLLNLINDILDLSKIKAGMLTIEKVNFDFNESIAGTALFFKEKAREKGIKLVVASDPFIPRLLTGDPHRLNQILNNLLSNAIKFTDEGFVRLEAVLHSETEDQVVIEFVVKDSGIGIDASNLHYIFDNFAQASSDISSKYGGTGLGLAITKRLIEMQGGEITVESTKGSGSTFTFLLPYAVAKDTEAVVNPFFYNEPVAIKKDYSGKRALIVEDNDINQAVLASSLKQHRMDFHIANHGQEAIHALETGEQFDIIFMDLRMPVMNGFETTAYIRQKLHLQVPIVILTASVLRNERDRCLEIGASHYMAKPFAMADLARTLEQHLPKAENQPETSGILASTEPISLPVSEPDFDISRLLELEDPEFIRHVFNLFVEKMPPYLHELKSILPTGNYEEFLEKTHKVKGSLSSVQIGEIYQQVVTMEEKVLAEKSLTNLEPILDKCLSLYTQLMPTINQEVEKQLVALEANK